MIYWERRKKKLLTIKDYSYENVKTIIIKIYDEYIEKAKKNCPLELDIWFKESCFISYCHGIYHKNIQINNFLDLIKNYFILDKVNKLCSNYRDKDLFEDIQ